MIPPANEPVRIAIDFETYFGTGCDIRKLGLSQYIKHPEFEVFTMAYRMDGMDGARVLVGEQIREFFEMLKRLDRPVVLIAHNMYFDGLVARYIYGYVPQFYCCTMSMSRALFQQFISCSLASVAKFLGLSKKIEGVLGNLRNRRIEDLSQEELDGLMLYNIRDTDLCWDIFSILEPSFPSEELKTIDVVLRMFCDPVLQVDGRLAMRLHEKEAAAKQAAIDNVGVPRGTLASSAKFFELLREEGYDPPMKWSEAFEKNIPAMSKDDIEFIAFEAAGDARLKDLIAARKKISSSLVLTRTKALVDRADANLPVYIGYCAAHTMRFGGGDKVNMQNFPSDEIRRCIRAPAGHKLVVVDASQIEARVNAWLAGQAQLVRQFATGEDPYKAFASKIFNLPVSQIDKKSKERYIGKTCILALGYQMGAKRLQDTLLIARGGEPMHLELSECQRLVNTYRSEFSAIAGQWERFQQHLYDMLPGHDREVEYGPLVFKAGQCVMPNGLSLYYPGLTCELNDYGRPTYSFTPHGVNDPVNMYGGKLTENIVQCLARIITTQHMNDLADTYRPVLMAHDEIVLCVPTHQAEQALQDAIQHMSVAPEWAEGLPLEGEGEIATFYGKY